MRWILPLIAFAAARADAKPTWASVNVALGDLVVGTQDVSVVAGEISVGKEVGPVQVRAEYDYLSLDQVGPMVPLAGVGHRLAGVARWDWWRVGDDSFAIRFGFEAGAGQSIIRWSEARGTLLRPDLSLGVSTNFGFNVGGRHLVGGDIGLRVLLLPPANPPTGAAVQLVCERCGARGPIDWGLLFTMGFSYAQ
jgi:hypothetical protein